MFVRVDPVKSQGVYDPDRIFVRVDKNNNQPGRVGPDEMMFVRVDVELPGVYDPDWMFVRVDPVKLQGINDPDRMFVRVDPAEVQSV